MLIQGAGAKKVATANGGYTAIPSSLVSVPQIVTGSSAYGSWVTAESSLSNTMLVVGIDARCTSTTVHAVDFVVQVGIGSSGAEVAIGTFWMQTLFADRGGYMVTIPFPFQIEAGTRVALRGSTTSGETVNCRLVAIRASDLVNL